MLRKQSVIWIAGLWIVFAGATVFGGDAADAKKAPPARRGYETPRFVVPYAETKPVIDGVIGDDEWVRAFSINAMQTTGKQVSERQTRFWMTWDEDNIYLAMRSPLREGERPRQWLRDPDNDVNVVFDDSYEIWIDVKTASPDGQPCFFQFLCNYAGTRWDVMHEPAVGNSRIGWTSGWEPKNRINEELNAWEWEMVVPRETLYKNTPFEDGFEMRTLFARNFKRPWEQNSVEGTSTFNASDSYTQLVLKKDVPAVHVLGVADPRKRSFGLRFAAWNDEATTLTWRFLSDGGIDETGDLAVAPGKLAVGGPGVGIDALPEPAPDKKGKPRRGANAGKGDYRINITDGDGNILVDWCAKRHLALKANIDKPVNDTGDVVRLSLQLNPVRDYIRVTGDFIQYDARDDIDACVVTFSRGVAGEDEKTVPGEELAKKTLRINDIAYVRGVIALEDLAPGRYVARMVCLDKDGKEVLERESVIDKRDPEKAFTWWNTTAGNIETVIDPWTPVRREGDDLHVWGRRMTVGAGGLPAQILAKAYPKTAQVEDADRPFVETRDGLFAGPAELRVALADGKIVTPKGAKTAEVSAADHRVVMTSESAVDGMLDVRGVVTAEFDGIYKVEMTLTPKQPLDVSSVRVVVPLRNDVAKSIHACGEGIRYGFNYGALDPDEKGSLWDCTCVDGQPLLVGSFIPYVWVGGMERGVAWFADSDEGWIPNDDVPAIEVRRDSADSTDLVLNLVGAPAVIDAPRTVTFAFMATPVKKMHRFWRDDQWWCGNTFHDMAGTGNVIWASLPFTVNEEKCKKLVERYHRGSIKDGPFNPAVPYWEYNSFGFQAKAPKYFSEHWRLRDGEGFWFDETFTDFVVHNIHDWAKTCGIDGWYLDNMRPVADDKIDAGRGYRLPDGRIQPTFSTFDTRRFFLRLRAAFHEARGHSWIVPHATNNLVVPWIAACDVLYDGEHHIIYPESGKDFMDYWSMERMRVDYSGKWGTAVNFMSEYQGNWRAEPGRHLKVYRSFAGLVALHDAIPSGNVRTSTVYRTYAPGRRAFGIAEDDVEFLGYWMEKTGIVSKTDGVYVAGWKRPGKILLLLTNTGEQTDATVSLDADALGLGDPATWTARDIEAGRAVPVQDKNGVWKIDKKWQPGDMAPVLDGNTLTVPIYRHDYRQIVIQPKTAEDAAPAE